MDGWKTTFLLGRPIFRCYVSFREGNWDDPPSFRYGSRAEDLVSHPPRSLRGTIPHLVLSSYMRKAGPKKRLGSMVINGYVRIKG